MRYFTFSILLGLFATFPASSADFTVKGTSVFGRSLPTGVVVIAPLRARLKPHPAAKAVMEFQLGDQLSVFSQTKQWYGIRVQLPQGSILAAWVEKSGIQVKATQKKKSVAPARPIASPVPMRVIPPPAQMIEPVASPTKAASKKSVHGFLRNEVGVFGGRAFDVKKYGVDQYRFGLYYAWSLDERFAFDLPVSYATGGPFDVMAAGVGARISIYTIDDWTFFARLGILGERVYDSDQSFYAATVEPSIGVRWQFHPHFGVSLDPGAEIMVYNRVDIPLNIRAQALLKVWTTW